MERVLHILLAVFVIALLYWPTHRLRHYLRRSGSPRLVAQIGLAAVTDIAFFALIFAWFDLFSLRDLIFFMIVHELLVVVPYAIWRYYTPEVIPTQFACTRIYLELFHDRRWLFFSLIGAAWIISIGSSVIYYWGFISNLHSPTYPAVFFVLTLYSGITLIALTGPSIWMLRHPALEDSARVKLLLGLYSYSIFVFVCALMAGQRSVVQSRQIRLLDPPYHLQAPLSAVAIIALVLIGFAIPMSLGAKRQAEGVRKLRDFEENTLRELTDGLRSPDIRDKVSFIDGKLDKLRDQEESRRRELVPPNYIVRKIAELLAKMEAKLSDEDPDVALDKTLTRLNEERDEATDDPYERFKLDLLIAAAAGNSWTTPDTWADRVKEIRDIGEQIEEFRKNFYSERLEGLNKYSRAVRWVMKIAARGQAATIKYLASFVRELAEYLDTVPDKDFRWRHLFWLQSFMADMTDARNEIDSLHKVKARREYIRECIERFDKKHDFAVRVAKEAREEKRFGGRVLIPFTVPVIMAAVTPFIHIGLGFKP